MGDVNGLVNKALGIPDHGARLAAGWAGRVAMLIPSSMPVRVLAFPISGGYAEFTRRHAEGGQALCASTGALGFGEPS
jgi:hypothetical protein